MTDDTAIDQVIKGAYEAAAQLCCPPSDPNKTEWAISLATRIRQLTRDDAMRVLAPRQLLNPDGTAMPAVEFTAVVGITSAT